MSIKLPDVLQADAKSLQADAKSEESQRISVLSTATFPGKKS